MTARIFEGCDRNVRNTHHPIDWEEKLIIKAIYVGDEL